MLPRIRNLRAVADDRREPVQQSEGMDPNIAPRRRYTLGRGRRLRYRGVRAARRPRGQGPRRARRVDPVAARARRHRRADPRRVRADVAGRRVGSSATTARTCPPARPARRRASTSSCSSAFSGRWGLPRVEDPDAAVYLRADAEAASVSRRVPRARHRPRADRADHPAARRRAVTRRRSDAICGAGGGDATQRQPNWRSPRHSEALVQRGRSHCSGR